jgi:hypothetical protein
VDLWAICERSEHLSIMSTAWESRLCDNYEVVIHKKGRLITGIIYREIQVYRVRDSLCVIPRQFMRKMPLIARQFMRE